MTTMTDADSLLGSMISDYRILAPLGSGGMGVVYQAEDLKLGRKVALKFLPPGLGDNPEAKSRFHQEARSAATLDHPNICTIYGFGETEAGQLYLTMAFYDGETLKKRIARGPLSLKKAVDVTRQVAEGLAASHSRGIIHRDVKPANVYLTNSGRVKVLDFGLAKVLGRGGLTQTGSSMGTPAYMSPEHARGERVDERTDLFSLGVMLYEMLAGKPPFCGSSVPAVLFSILSNEPEELGSVRPDTPPELARITHRLLSKKPRDRYRSCRDLLADLAQVPLPASAGETPEETSGTAAEDLPTVRTATPAIQPPRAEERTAPEEEVELWLSAGLEAALARNYPLAVEAFERVLHLRPDDSRARFNLKRIRDRIAEREGGPRPLVH